MKKLIGLFLLIILGFSASCVRIESSPMIDFTNSSPDGKPIKNIKVNWNGYYLLGINHSINVCGEGLSQNFNMKRESDLFGPVHIEWENANNEKLTKDFIFTRKDFPSFRRRAFEPYVYYYINLFFTQNDVEYYTSDNPNIRKIEREKRGNWVYKWYEKEGKTKCVNDPKEVQRLREINKKYPVTSTVTGKPVNDD